MKKILMLCAIMCALFFSCTNEDDDTSTNKPLAEQILGDWRMDQCNMLISYGGDSAVPAYEEGSLWKFYKGEDSPVGTIWMNGVRKFYYTLTGDLLHTSTVESMDAGSYYTVEIIAGSTMNVYRRDNNYLYFVLTRI